MSRQRCEREDLRAEVERVLVFTVDDEGHGAEHAGSEEADRTTVSRYRCRFCGQRWEVGNPYSRASRQPALERALEHLAAAAELPRSEVA